MEITDFIPVGRKNAISNETLALTLGTDKRNARAQVLAARMRGVPICSTCGENGGYFLPADEGEALVYYRQQNHRIKTARAALNGVKKYLREVRRNGH